MNRGVRLVSALGLLTAVLLGAAAIAGAAGGGTRTETFGVAGSCSTGGQICPSTVADAGSLTSYSDLKVVFTASGSHCSDMALRIFVDGKHEATTSFTGPGGKTKPMTVPWPKDGQPHVLGYEGQGRTGGCNGGNLVLWNGSLAVTYKAKERKKVNLSGTVFKRSCEPSPNHCHHLQVVPASGEDVTIHLPGLGGGYRHDETGRHGTYSFEVKRGHRYTLQVHGAKGSVDPESRSVDATKDLGNLNFTLCGRTCGRP